MLAARTGKTNLFSTLLVPALLCSLGYPLLELHRSCLEPGQDKMSPRGGREQTFLQQTRAVLLDYHHIHGVQRDPTSRHWKLPSTTAGEFSPRSLSPDFPMASSAPDRRWLHSAAHRNASPMVSVTFPQIIQALHFSSTDFSSTEVSPADDNAMLNICFCSCLTQTQVATDTDGTCPL